jgi:hypothetical protein
VLICNPLILQKKRIQTTESLRHSRIETEYF